MVANGDAGRTLGRITISTGAVAQLVEYAAVECYGVVALGRRASRVGRLLEQGRASRAVDVQRGDEGLVIGVHVVVEHGLNLAEVAAAIRSRIAYEVGRSTGLAVASVDVHIGAVRA